MKPKNYIIKQFLYVLQQKSSLTSWKNKINKHDYQKITIISKVCHSQMYIWKQLTINEKSQIF